MIFGFDVVYVTQILGKVHTETLVVTEFRFLALLVLILAVLVLALGVLSFKFKFKHQGLVLTAGYLLVAILILVVGLTMSSGFSADMLEAIANIEETNVKLAKIGLELLPVPYWKVGLGTFLGMGLSLVAAGVSVYSSKVK